MVPLQALLPQDLAIRCGIDISDARRLVAQVHKHGRLPDKAPATIRRAALDAVRAFGHVPSLALHDKRASAVDPFVKYVLATHDGHLVETVRIPLEKPGRFSVCVSSQVGCALACAFCATGRMGLQRNLETWEIIDQVRVVRAELPVGARVHGVVFQGMGEPLANVERVIAAVRVMGEAAALAIDMRNITVCTAGLPGGIRKLAAEVPRVRLGLSIGDARPKRRSLVMPIDQAHALDEVLVAAGEHAQKTGYSPMWAYTLLAGDNDGADAAEALADRAIAFAARWGVRPRISLIPWNDVEGAAFARSSDGALDAFRAVIRARGVGTIVRYSGGGDVEAACGQLASTAAPGARTGAAGPAAPRPPGGNRGARVESGHPRE